MYQSSPESLHFSNFHSITLPSTRMSHFEWLSGLHSTSFVPLIQKGQIYIDRFQLYSVWSNTGSSFLRTLTQPWQKWVLFLDCKEHPINPEAAISNANLNLRGGSARRWLIISPLASGVNAEWPFYGCPKVEGAWVTWSSKEHKGTNAGWWAAAGTHRPHCFFCYTIPTSLIICTLSALLLG